MNKETIHEAYRRLHRLETDEIVEYAYNIEQENEQLKTYKLMWEELKNKTSKSAEEFRFREYYEELSMTSACEITLDNMKELEQKYIKESE